jgi:epoxide hydrolase
MNTATDTAIRPFRVDIPQADLDDLNERLAHTAGRRSRPGRARAAGYPRATFATWRNNWRTGFDWRRQEARLNPHPQFTTEIDGQTIHLVHVR